jgi:predicted Zn-ribbon and HTH transcriptional regulator
MEEGKKKMIMVAIIVVCIAAAVIITVATHSGSSGGIDSIPPDQMVWLKCRNPKCENEWQMGKRAYFEYLEKHHDPTAMTVAPIDCPKCGEKSGYRAEKCVKCGFIFERGSVPNDVADRCPKCGNSATEESRKKASSGE